MEIPFAWGAVIGLSLGVCLTLVVILRLYKSLSTEKFLRRSQSTKYGKLTEQFLPLVENYPWDPSNFRFLGTPIDGVQFEEDRIILVEFKASNSKLSKLQRHIRNLVNEGKVEFQIVRVG